MISTDYSKSEEIFKHVDNIVMQVKETQEEFIFSTLSKYAMDNFNAVVEKEELVQAIQLIRMCKEHGPGICERWTTATQQTAHLNDAYRRGFHDGVTEERDRIMSILEREEKRMKVRTDTQCAYCTHNQVCVKLNKPIDLVEDLINFNAEDDNGIVVVVSCTDFEKKIAHTKTDHDFGFDC